MKPRFVLLALIVAVLAIAAFAYASARSRPIERELDVTVEGWPAATRPIRVALLSDIHIGNAAMDAARLDRIVTQVNAARPDLVLLAGDFIAGNVPRDALAAPRLIAPLRHLRAPLGVVAVLGNHDYWTNAVLVRRSLERAGVTVLANSASVRGPLLIGGLDDQTSRHARLAPTLLAMAGKPGVRIVLAHSPDVAARLHGDVDLILAGHTHCGQIVLPLIGPPVDEALPRYRCGVVREGRRTTLITAGVGTSVVPLRFGAPPDWWLLTFHPAPRPLR